MIDGKQGRRDRVFREAIISRRGTPETWQNRLTRSRTRRVVHFDARRLLQPDIHFGYHQSMRIHCSPRSIFMFVVLALSSSPTWAEDLPAARPLVHVSFNRLVPTSYPVFRPSFNRLRPTTYPLIRPGVPQVGITNNLTDSFARPLLLTSPVSRPFTPATQSLSAPWSAFRRAAPSRDNSAQSGRK